MKLKRGNKLKEHVNKKTNKWKKNKLAFKFTYFNSYENILLQTMDIVFFWQNVHLFLQREKRSIKQDLNCHLSQKKDPDKIYLETYIQDFWESSSLINSHYIHYVK